MVRSTDVEENPNKGWMKMSIKSNCSENEIMFLFYYKVFFVFIIINVILIWVTQQY